MHHAVPLQVMAPPGSVNTSRDLMSGPLLAAVEGAFGSVDDMLVGARDTWVNWLSGRCLGTWVSWQPWRVPSGRWTTCWWLPGARGLTGGWA